MKNRESEISPVFWHSLKSRPEMRKPLKTKKRSTPIHPPRLNVSVKECNAGLMWVAQTQERLQSTKAIAVNRRISSVCERFLVAGRKATWFGSTAEHRRARQTT